MKLYCPNQVIPFPEFKAALIRHTWIWSVLATLIVAIAFPTLLRPFVIGVVTGYLYLKSLIFTTEHPQKRWAFVISMVRMVFVSFLIVNVGQFKLLDTCVVFLGFLSYKVVLIVELLRRSVGFKRSSGK